MSHRRTIAILLKILLTLIILFFVGRQLESNWTAIENFDWQIEFIPAMISIGLALVALLLFAVTYRYSLKAFKDKQNQPIKITVWDSFKILYLSNLGRYIPGKIWQMFGMIYLSKKRGIEPETAGMSFVLLQMFTIPASLLVFVLASQMESKILIDQVQLLGPYSAVMLTALMLLLCLFLIFYPKPLLLILNYVLRKLNRPVLNFQLDKSVALVLFLGYFLCWIIYGLAFYYFVKAVTGESSPNLVASIGIFAFSYQIGYLALFAPGGFGPREFVMGTMLQPFVGPIAPAVAILARIWAVIYEALAALFALVIKMK